MIPAGEFQPSSLASWGIGEDLSLWRSVVREFSEELLGTPEHDGSGSTPIDYETWPLFRTLERARAERRVLPFCLGIGLDALTLAATVLTVVVIDEELFGEAFHEVVHANAEGVLVTRQDGNGITEWIPFTEGTVERLLTSEPLAPPGAACLALAWRHRATLLAGRA